MKLTPSPARSLLLPVLLLAAGLSLASTPVSAQQDNGEQPPSVNLPENLPGEESGAAAAAEDLPGMLTRGPVTLRVVMYPGPSESVEYRRARTQVTDALSAILDDPQLPVSGSGEGEQSVFEDGSNRLEYRARSSNPNLLEEVIWEARAPLEQLRAKAPRIFDHIKNRVGFVEEGITRVYLGPAVRQNEVTRIYFGPYFYREAPDMGSFLNQVIRRDAPAWEMLTGLWVEELVGNPKLSTESLREQIEREESLREQVLEALSERVENPPEDTERLIRFIDVNEEHFQDLANSEEFQDLVDVHLELVSLMRFAESRIRSNMTQNHPELEDFKFKVNVVLEGRTSRLN